MHEQVWPDMGGRAWLQAPEWIKKRLGDKPRSNVQGLDFRASGSGLNKGAKGKSGKKRTGKAAGKGRKLG